MNQLSNEETVQCYERGKLLADIRMIYKKFIESLPIKFSNIFTELFCQEMLCQEALHLNEKYVNETMNIFRMKTITETNEAYTIGQKAMEIKLKSKLSEVSMKEYFLNEFKQYYTNQRNHSKDRLDIMKNDYKLWNNLLKVLNYHVYNQLSNIKKSNVSNLATVCFNLQQTIEIWGFIGRWLIDIFKLYDLTILNQIDKIILKDWYILYESMEKDLYIQNDECKQYLEKLDSMLKSLDVYFKHDRLINTQNSLDGPLDLLQNLLKDLKNMISNRRIQLQGENGIIKLLTKLIRNIEDFIQFIQSNTINDENSKNHSTIRLDHPNRITNELEVYNKKWNPIHHHNENKNVLNYQQNIKKWLELMKNRIETIYEMRNKQITYEQITIIQQLNRQMRNDQQNVPMATHSTIQKSFYELTESLYKLGIRMMKHLDEKNISICYNHKTILSRLNSFKKDYLNVQSGSEKLIGVYNQSIIRYLQSTDGTIRESLLADILNGQPVETINDTESTIELPRHLLDTNLAYLALLKQNEYSQLVPKTETMSMEHDKETAIIEQQWIDLCHTTECLEHQLSMKQDELKRLTDILQIKMEVLDEQ
ncbi:putative normocyte-binding protein 1 [Schistosoma mansoni]|uniref:putative normocyte-binding protein 1 n=1 Tax=Schistosoma mansoni TaxID=6183 RepID=UPI00022DC161|nr:putative normocyte-binding protein 1 [Schistosoma mansoni]|eukprot:XP_018649711.1 putative normocyte-binding protein 1 [Schistosoma mansoni]